jgi:hypothetical protein
MPQGFRMFDDRRKSGAMTETARQILPWASMRRGKLPTQLRYKDDVFRTDSQGQGN